MTTRKNPQRAVIVALLGTIALHLTLIASATVWLTTPVKPDQPENIQIVTLHGGGGAAAAAAFIPAPAAAVNKPKSKLKSKPKNKPKTAALAKNSAAPKRPQAVPKIVSRQKVQVQAQPQPQPLAAAQKQVPDVSQQPQISDAPDASDMPAKTPQSQQQIAPSSTQIQAPDAIAAINTGADIEAPQLATKTGVWIPAAYAARNRKPAYPLMSRRYNEQGTVVLRILVDAGGTAGEVRIRKSSGYPLLDQSAFAAAHDWRFAAATRNGKPVSEWYEISIPYTLRD